MTDGKALRVLTAIIAPLLYVVLGKVRSRQTSWLTGAILKHGRAITVGEGKNTWDGETRPKLFLDTD